MMLERYRVRRPVMWGPLFGMRGLQNDMNLMFSGHLGEQDGNAVSTLTPAIDLVDSGDRVEVKVELPGMAKDDVDISLKDDILTIKGEKKQEREEKEENRYYVERTYGSFSRTLTLPSKVNPDGVEARFKDGVLEINLPKAEEEKIKQIQVQVD
jgi:HSP20 family protein